MTKPPAFHADAPLQFVINGAAGSHDVDARRGLIESALRAHGRRGELQVCRPASLPGVAQEAAHRARQSGTAVVAVGGDGTLNAVAQAAHAQGCAMGVVPLGTFNYFARTHGIPVDPGQALACLMQARPEPVQVAAVNDRLFLVNASLGLYPELLEDRESYKARFGRSRWVAIVSACATLLRARRRWHVHIEMAGQVRELQALTLFVGNNRLQLQQLGAEPEDTIDGTPGDGSMGALVLRPVGRLSMIALMFKGAVGRLGEAAGVERFEFQHMQVRPTLPQGIPGTKVAFDGEVATLSAPLNFRIHERPLYLLTAPRWEPQP